MFDRSTDVMDDLDAAPEPLDAALARRIELLNAARATREASTPPSSAGRKDRRRHPAKYSRLAALALSLATTGGLTAGFAAMDSPSSSVVTASGGIVGEASAATTTLNGAESSGATTLNGDVYTNRWGPVQVQVTFAGDGSLASVDAVQSPYVDGKSVRINDRAVPVLNREALSSQSAQVDTVSGATYTSQDYERSLQSAIDTARAAGLTQLA